MKRSEMVKKIEDTVTSALINFDNFKQVIPSQVANDILLLVEEAGMLPPNWIKTRPDGIKLRSFTWEPEDE